MDSNAVHRLRNCSVDKVLYSYFRDNIASKLRKEKLSDQELC